MKPQQVIEEIEALSAHYVRPVRSPDEHDRWLADYVEDLKGLPDHALRLACRSWRGASANTKMPTPGQLAALAREYVREHRGPDEAFCPWRHLEAADYDRLSLREKIRYQLIAASEAREKAGPLWSNNRPCTPENLPPDRRERWTAWTVQAARHAAEADRLEKFMRREDATG